MIIIFIKVYNGMQAISILDRLIACNRGMRKANLLSSVSKLAWE